MLAHKWDFSLSLSGAFMESALWKTSLETKTNANNQSSACSFDASCLLLLWLQKWFTSITHIVPGKRTHLNIYTKMVMLTSSAAMNQSIYNHYTTKPCICHLQKKLVFFSKNSNAANHLGYDVCWKHLDCEGMSCSARLDGQYFQFFFINV